METPLFKVEAWKVLGSQGTEKCSELHSQETTRTDFGLVINSMRTEAWCGGPGYFCFFCAVCVHLWSERLHADIMVFQQRKLLEDCIRNHWQSDLWKPRKGRLTLKGLLLGHVNIFFGERPTHQMPIFRMSYVLPYCWGFMVPSIFWILTSCWLKKTFAFIFWVVASFCWL